MAVSAAAAPVNKRHKPDGMPPDGMPPGHGHMPPQRYPQQGYGAPPGYMGWQAQYGSHAPPPPHGWQGAPAQGPPGMYPQRGGPPMTPERGGNWSGYRSPHAPHQPPAPNAPGKAQPPPPPRGGGRPMKPTGKAPPKAGDPPGPMPPQQYGAPPGGPGGWSGPGQPWGGPQWNGGPPPPPPGQWHSGHPPPQQMHQPPPPPPHYQSGWSGASQTPPRRPRASPEMMNRGMMGPGSYPPPTPGGVCPPVGMDAPPPGDSDMYVTSRGVGMHDDDGQSSVGKNSEKGRGSYKCGRCGVPKKGHVCPYQPKVKRRSGEPAPEMKSAAIQVEMDEFMTLRRLNIRIQGFPESYATDPTMADMVVGEPRPPMARPGMMPTPDGPPPMMGGPEAPRSSPHPAMPGPSVLPGPPLNEPTKG